MVKEDWKESLKKDIKGFQYKTPNQILPVELQSRLKSKLIMHKVATKWVIHNLKEKDIEPIVFEDRIFQLDLGIIHLLFVDVIEVLMRRFDMPEEYYKELIGLPPEKLKAINKFIGHISYNILEQELEAFKESQVTTERLMNNKSNRANLPGFMYSLIRQLFKYLDPFYYKKGTYYRKTLEEDIVLIMKSYFPETCKDLSSKRIPSIISP